MKMRYYTAFAFPPVGDAQMLETCFRTFRKVCTRITAMDHLQKPECHLARKTGSAARTSRMAAHAETSFHHVS